MRRGHHGCPLTTHFRDDHGRMSDEGAGDYTRHAEGLGPDRRQVRPRRVDGFAVGECGMLGRLGEVVAS